MSTTPHSAAVLTDLRDRWWSTDFLELIVSRLELKKYQRVADLGCGHGHWGQRLLPLLSDTATLTGLDQEVQWVDKATKRASQLGLNHRSNYCVGTIENLPFEDDSFDLVTCQTLLMHVADVDIAISEILRVTRPGGRVLFAEPNNVAQQLIADTVNRTLTPQQLGDVMTLFTACSRGRDALDRGDDCIGDRLPSLLKERSVDGLSVFQNECTGHIVPPYDEHEQSQLRQAIGYAESHFWLWDKSDARLLYEAGNGRMDDFERIYEAFSYQTQVFKKQVESETYASNNASLGYIISATRSLLSSR